MRKSDQPQPAAPAETPEDRLAATLRELDERRRPVEEALLESARQWAEAAGQLRHLVVDLEANRDLTAESLKRVAERLEDAAGRLETAAGEWGRLVRSGLASTSEFSRQAIEALLEGLEAAPPDFGRIAETADRLAASTDQMNHALATSLDQFQARLSDTGTRLTSLLAAVEEQLTGVAKALTGQELTRLGVALGALDKTIGQLQQTVGGMARMLSTESGLGELAKETRLLREALRAGPATRPRWSWPARLMWAIVLVYVLLALGLTAGLVPDFVPW